MKGFKKVKELEAVETSSGWTLLVSPDLQELVKFVQVLPERMMQELKKVAEEKGLSLELELVSRVLATFVEPEVLGVESLFGNILKQEFTDKNAFQECAINHERWIYPYEIKKLELLLEFHGKLPRTFKETFSVIDVKQEKKRLLKEIRDRNKSKDRDGL